MIYKRVLLKLSGESLGGESGRGLDEGMIGQYAREIAALSKKGAEIAVVIGGGNIFRGLSGIGKGYDRVCGDNMGMLATVINSLALSQAIKSNDVDAEVFTSIRMEPVANYYVRDNAEKALKRGSVVIIAGGTGNPFFTTDSASALRAVELGVEVLLKGTRVDGVYTADPEKDKNAVKYDDLSFETALEKSLKVMDLTAFALCKENKMPILVFDMNTPGNLTDVLEGEKIGTLVQ